MVQEIELKQVRVMPVLKRYVKAAMKHPWLMATVFLGVLITQAGSIAGALALKSIIDSVSTLMANPTSAHIVYGAVAIYAVLVFIEWVGNRMVGFGLSSVEPPIMAELSDSAFTYLIYHSHDFFISNFSGTLTRRVTRYARVFESLLDTFAFSFFPTFLYAVGVIIVLFMRSALLGSIVLIWTILFITAQILMTKWRQPLRLERSKQDSAMTGAISDAIGNHHPIVLFATEKHERRLFAAVVDKWKQAMLRSWIADSWIWGIQGFFAIGIEVALIALSVHYWGQGILTVGDIVLIQVYIISLIDRILNLNNAMRSMYDAFADAYEMVAILEQPLDIQDDPQAQDIHVTAGEIEFEAVDFTFTGERGILHDYTLTVQAGEKIALVGPSGAGKSTVTKLLLRLHDATKGTINIDGQDITKVTQRSLRRAISYVPQEATLFHRTLIDNIRYGRLDATDDEVVEAAKKAHAHEFITQLPERYGTFVGERGVKLSGGERQRIAIARAILKNAPILVLDEATASLDSENEHLIQEALQTLMEGKTVLVIAHRLSTIMNMDRIIVMEQGRVVAEGTHSELLSQNGIYARLWNIQAGGFIGEDTDPV